MESIVWITQSLVKTLPPCHNLGKTRPFLCENCFQQNVRYATAAEQILNHFIMGLHFISGMFILLMEVHSIFLHSRSLLQFANGREWPIYRTIVNLNNFAMIIFRHIVS